MPRWRRRATGCRSGSKRAPYHPRARHASAGAVGSDGNGKEKKDLVALGVLPRDTAQAWAWPEARCFLVVSADFAERLRSPSRHGLRRGLFHYEERLADGPTRVFEVRPGPKPASAG